MSGATVFAYGLPILGVGLMWNMLSFYLLKFSTDVLLIAPGVMGAIFGASRIWDAVTDPIAGYWSDKTQTRWGRRRPWMLVSVVPLALLFVAAWSPPASLEGTALVVWMAVSLLLLYTALTAFRIPHASLGAELTLDYHDRTRVFAGATVAEALGGLLGAGALALVLALELDMRQAAPRLASAIGLLAVVLVTWSVVSLRERPDHLTRGGRRPFRALLDVWHNHHARRLTLIFFLQVAGLVCATTTLPYAAQYLLGDEALMALLLLAFILGLMAGLPIWSPVSRRFGKREVWIAARLGEAAAFSLLFFAPFVPLPVLLAIVAVAGVCDGANGIVGRSIEADVIDVDEARTGERKEGVYFAVWALGSKVAVGAGLFAVGMVLQLSGFEPGAEQSQASLLAVRLLLSAAPTGCMLAGVALTFGFSLSEREHARLLDPVRAQTLKSTFSTSPSSTT